MITVLFKDCNHFSQKIYDQRVGSIRIQEVQCSCGVKGCLVFHGRYTRHLKFLSELIPLSVRRVYCKHCHKTHALLPSLIVPYSQIPLQDQQEILEDICSGRSPEPVMERNLLIDENNVKYIVRQFQKNWKHRLLSIGKTLKAKLTIPCLNAFSRQFMQSHITGNILFSPPT